MGLQVEAWTDSLNKRISELRDEARYLKKVEGNLEDFEGAVNFCCEMARECYDVQGEINPVVATDPDSGAPYVRIDFGINRHSIGVDRALHRYLRKTRDVSYRDLIVLNWEYLEE